MTHWSHTTPTARRSHVCGMCRRTIEPGETYSRGAGMDGATAWTWKECAHCAAFVRYAYASAGWGDGYDDALLIDFEPATVAQARVRAQHRRAWRRLDGVLYPVPTVIVREDARGFGRFVDIQPGVTR